MDPSDAAWPPPLTRWERLFADLDAEMEQQSAAEQAAEIADRTRGEVGCLRLVDRLRPAVGDPVELRMCAGTPVRGELREVGPDWVLLTERSLELVVALHAVCAVSGLGRWSAVPGSEGRVTARLDLRYAVRRLTRERATVAITLVNGDVLTGTCDRVGADFVELAEHQVGDPRRSRAVRRLRTLPLAAVAVLRTT
jgi:hypothetical protein